MARRAWAAALAALALIGALPLRGLAAEERIGRFLDLNPHAWYASGVRYCVEKELMSGYGNVNLYFAPDAVMSRAELAVLLWRMNGSPVTGLTMLFTDVEEDSWYAGAVRWASSTQLMPGESPTVFAPASPVTREQLAVALWRCAALQNGFVPHLDSPEFETYRDYDTVSDEAEEAMRWANALGIITGTKDVDGSEVLTPWASVSRAGAATILMRFSLDMAL